jgi:hypothetical protein
VKEEEFEQILFPVVEAVLDFLQIHGKMIL